MESIESQAAEASGRRARQAGSERPVNAVAKAESPINEAFGYASDRSERVVMMIEQLDNVVDRAWHALENVLTPEAARAESLDRTSGAVAVNDRHSTIARRVTDLAQQSDSQADRLSCTTQRLEALLDAVQL